MIAPRQLSDSTDASGASFAGVRVAASVAAGRSNLREKDH